MPVADAKVHNSLRSLGADGRRHAVLAVVAPVCCQARNRQSAYVNRPPVRPSGTSTVFKLLAATLLAAALVAVGPAGAFGGAGHRLVADQADRQLTPAARAEVTRLLALEPGATMQSVSTWADETRSLGTGPWHYVNFHRGEPCTYEPARLCIAGKCVVGALDQQIEVLGSNAPDADRLTALKFVVHLVADVHQPLHAGFFDDRGGNSYQLQAFDKGTNLHALWDSGLIGAWPGGLDALQAAVHAEPPVVVQGSPMSWAEESCRIVGQARFYPDGRSLAPEYLPLWGPTLVQRLRAAGQRLGTVLNRTLGEK